MVTLNVDEAVVSRSPVYTANDYVFLSTVRDNLNGSKIRHNKYRETFLQKTREFNFKGKYLPEITVLAKGSRVKDTSRDELASALGENQSIRNFVIKSEPELSWVSQNRQHFFSASLLKDANIVARVDSPSTAPASVQAEPHTNGAALSVLALRNSIPLVEISPDEYLKLDGEKLITDEKIDKSYQFKNPLGIKIAERLNGTVTLQRSYRSDFLTSVESGALHKEDIPHLLRLAVEASSDDTLAKSLGKNKQIRSYASSKDECTTWALFNNKHAFAQSLLEDIDIAARVNRFVVAKKIIYYLNNADKALSFTQDELERTNFTPDEASAIFSAIKENQLSGNSVAHYLGYNRTVRDHVAKTRMAIDWLGRNQTHLFFASVTNDRRISSQITNPGDDLWSRRGAVPQRELPASVIPELQTGRIFPGHVVRRDEVTSSPEEQKLDNLLSQFSSNPEGLTTYKFQKDIERIEILKAVKLDKYSDNSLVFYLGKNPKIATNSSAAHHAEWCKVNPNHEFSRGYGLNEVVKRNAGLSQNLSIWAIDKIVYDTKFARSIRELLEVA